MNDGLMPPDVVLRVDVLVDGSVRPSGPRAPSLRCAPLLITIDQQGMIQATGPLGDKITAYGLLEATKEIIARYGTEQRRIIPGVALPPRPP